MLAYQAAAQDQRRRRQQGADVRVSVKGRKTIVLSRRRRADQEAAVAGPMVAFIGGDRDERDVSRPIAYDEHGNPLYAPRGITVRIA